MDDEAAYRALLSRDARFDGRLFVGVTSTGIYCRPICRVRTPKRANCRFFASAAQAEAQAFRPCLKCRPEIAPRDGETAWSVMDASRTLARQAARHLDAQATSGELPSLAALAARLGVSDRHLRRIFLAEHGVTPLQHLQTQRLLLAKQLLTDSTLAVSQVALASGFRSLRRFNAAFVDSYRMSPGRLRRASSDVAAPAAASARTATATATAADAAGAVCVTLAYRPPYDVTRLLRFLAQRAIAATEQVDVDGSLFGAPGVRRNLRAGVLSAQPGWIEALFPPAAAQVRLRFAPGWARDSGAVVAAARRWLDLDASPQHIGEVLHGLPAVMAAGAEPEPEPGLGGGAEPASRPLPAGATTARIPGQAGLRLPGCLDGFELAVRAVLGQQVSVAAARTLAGRLVDRFGVPLVAGDAGLFSDPVDRQVRPAVGDEPPRSSGTPSAPTHCFPSPPALANAPVGAISELGIVGSRAAAIVALAGAWPGLLPLTAPHQPPEPLIERLCALPGIGAWTAHYIAMRALGWPDAFPPNDVALLKAMQRLFGAAAPAAPLRQREADAIAQAWRPWRSYAVLGLWNTLEAGNVASGAAA